MQIINSDTNATVSGVVLPLGEVEWPVMGALTIVTSGGWSNEVVVGSSDVILVDRSQVQVVEGPDVILWFAAGLMATLGSGVIIGFARYMGRALGGAGRVEF